MHNANHQQEQQQEQAQESSKASGTSNTAEHEGRMVALAEIMGLTPLQAVALPLAIENAAEKTGTGVATFITYMERTQELRDYIRQACIAGEAELIGETTAYEAKQEHKRERLEDRAERLHAESHRAYERSKEMADCIPFGQPILVGHHSEKRDRAFRGKIMNGFQKSYELDKAAKHVAGRAASVGTGGISSDDSAAVLKLATQLAEAKESQERMKKTNAILRKHKDDESRTTALQAIGFDACTAAAILKPDCYGGIGFPHYKLSNNNANIRRIEKRIAELQARRQREDVEQQGEHYTYREDVDSNRIDFEFSGKPDAAVRDVLKRAAFRWAPSRGAWTRQLSGNARYAADRVRKQLDELFSGTNPEASI